MKKILAVILFVSINIACYAQWSIGLRDNQYVNVAYELKDKWEFKLEHSVFAEKLPFQYIRANVGYKQPVNKFAFTGMVYGGAIYNDGRLTITKTTHVIIVMELALKMVKLMDLTFIKLILILFVMVKVRILLIDLRKLCW